MVLYSDDWRTFSQKEIPFIGLEWAFVFILVIVITAGPFFLAWKYALERAITSLLFWFIASAITAGVGDALNAFVSASLGEGDPNGLTLTGALIRFLPMYLIGAAVGSLLCGREVTESA